MYLHRAPRSPPGAHHFSLAHGVSFASPVRLEVRMGKCRYAANADAFKKTRFSQVLMGSGFRFFSDDVFARSAALSTIHGRLPAALLRLRSGTGSPVKLAAPVGVIG